MEDIYQERNLTKHGIYSRCQFCGIKKVVQSRIYACCVIFGQSIRQNIEIDLVSVNIDENWRHQLHQLNIEPFCRCCFVDVEAPTAIEHPAHCSITDTITPSKCRSDMTLFCIPKPFVGHTGIIQRNAIKSWTKLQPRPEIILCGDDPGTAELADELGLQHIPKIGRNEYGTPLVSSIFQEAEAQSTSDWLAYVNADVILLDDFAKALTTLKAELGRFPIRNFFLSSQRIEIDVSSPLDFDQLDWEGQLLRVVEEKGVLDHKGAIEIFLFARGLYRHIPPFAIGRSVWDNWLVWKAKDLGAAIIDGTESFLVIHQCHDYGHVPGGWKGASSGEEAQRNSMLAGEHHLGWSNHAHIP